MPVIMYLYFDKRKFSITFIPVKQEKVDEEEKDVKPKLENGVLKEEPAAAPETVKMRLPEDLKVRELFDSKDPQLIFLQVMINLSSGP